MGKAFARAIRRSSSFAGRLSKITTNRLSFSVMKLVENEIHGTLVANLCIPRDDAISTRCFHESKFSTTSGCRTMYSARIRHKPQSILSPKVTSADGLMYCVMRSTVTSRYHDNRPQATPDRRYSTHGLSVGNTYRPATTSIDVHASSTPTRSMA